MTKAKNKLPGEIYDHIIQAINAARLNQAGFGDMLMVAGGKEWKIDNFIKDNVRGYNERGIIAPLMQVLAWASGTKIEDFREPQGVDRFLNKFFHPQGDVQPGHHPLARTIIIDIAQDAETQVMIGVQQLMATLPDDAAQARVLEYLLKRLERKV